LNRVLRKWNFLSPTISEFFLPKLKLTCFIEDLRECSKHMSHSQYSCPAQKGEKLNTLCFTICFNFKNLFSCHEFRAFLFNYLYIQPNALYYLKLKNYLQYIALIQYKLSLVE
jgi:hypothetical protein